MPARGQRIARHTVLLVGEGKTECAFLRHIKSLYISRGCGVSAKIRNAHGRGPGQVVNYAIKQCGNAAYDRGAVLLDTDLEMSATARKRAKSKKIQIIGSTPCVEGLLLKILNKPVPNTCAECKTLLKRFLPAQLTNPDNYQADFPKEILEERRHAVPELEALLGYLSFDS